MSVIDFIHGREILDSRGNPTVEVDLVLKSGEKVLASVPSGASTGKREAVELRDNDKKRYDGKGVLHAVDNINTIINKEISNKDVKAQSEIDKILIDLDGTGNKSKLGANSILAVSLAVLKASALVQNKGVFEIINQNKKYLMPVPMMNVINGGAHADNKLDIQEFMIVPHGAKSFSESLRYGAEVFYCLKSLLHQKGYTTSVGDEGGFAPGLSSSNEAIEFILNAIEKSGFSIGKDISIALDVAASEFYKNEEYMLIGNKTNYSSSQFVTYLSELAHQYPIISIEDGMDEDDWEGWSNLTLALKDKCQLVGDDLFVTNKTYLQKGIDENIANAILIKLNQIGTVTETLDTIKLAKENGYATIISHRSGETEDTTIADLAVGVSAGQIKTGSLSRTDRIAKYNQLLRIEDNFSEQTYFDGKSVFAKYLK